MVMLRLRAWTGKGPPDSGTPLRCVSRLSAGAAWHAAQRDAVVGIVAGDAAVVVQGHRADVADAAAVGVGGVAGDGAAAVQGHRVAVLDAGGAVAGVAGDRAVVQGHRAVVADAAAVEGGVVAGDGAAVQGHRAAVVVDAATVALGSVAADRGAVERHSAGVVVDAAAVFFEQEADSVAGDGGVIERQRAELVDDAAARCGAGDDEVVDDHRDAGVDDQHAGLAAAAAAARLLREGDQWAALEPTWGFRPRMGAALAAVRGDPGEAAALAAQVL